MQAARILTLAAVATATVALAADIAEAAEQACAAGTLGISRTIEVDTTGGPWFGAPKGDPKFLQPKEVVLTFDDGPSPANTRKILAALAKECTTATFFVVGEMVAVHPEVIKEIADQGHTIGTHTWSHPNLARRDIDDVKHEVEATFNAAQKASPTPIAPFFRYPYLSSSDVTEDYMKSRNIGQFAVDIDSQDWRVRSAKPVVARVMAGLKARGRGIILMHDIHRSTADAVPQLLAQLKAGGYQVVQLKPKEKVDLIADVTPPEKPAHTQRARKRGKAAAGKTQRKMALRTRKPAA
ncbi:polysaccharide deacetylase [Hyphomicrobium denitrificans ATCC 51888]|uniref:Chitooligosaccharide deacetylase n=1 Tax=Hyphomicrobium denitrificans (strain ATCC 51888 / DSM 1869 / NCIMB 11706 / TK 0415) TaxID=582899 RepID=D8JRY1_HYPDA|nr:polysaccharide deacetylase family protein [Hyphomicrobium denitrificans]ADJ24199.1 polysaccharide deacetylase [Hyphomicrobium denitrificans ATCC 51888]